MQTILVSMPWASTVRPSLALGTLVAVARERGFACKATYPNLTFAADLGATPYELLSNTPSLFPLAEHLFAVDIFGKEALDSDTFIQRYLSTLNDDRQGAFDGFRRVREDMIPMFLEKIVQSLLDQEPAVIGFTCTFNQVLASLALARRLKAIHPKLRILLGGACVHDTMGEAYAAAFQPWIDHVFTGEADASFLEFLERIAAGRELAGIPGVTCNGKSEQPAQLFFDLDHLHPPNYDDYFRERESVTVGSTLPDVHSLPFESSRGCWWGAKHHCTFCGLNNMGMRYRSKSDDRVIHDVYYLSMRYGMLRFMAADNILDHRAYKGLLEEFAKTPLDVRLFYEIKANVKRSQVTALARAGVREVQPGVESFSDHVLALMRKGVSVLQIVQMLKWLAEYAINPIYNVLVGFPGEEAQDYVDMIDVISTIRHLPPPSSKSAIVEVHRFSPFHSDPDAYGLGSIRAADFYSSLIPADILPPTDCAFFFQRDIPDDSPLWQWQDRLDSALRSWIESSSRKTARLGCGFIEIESIEDGKQTEVRILAGVDAVVFLLLDRQSTIEDLHRRLRGSLSISLIREALRRLVGEGLVLKIGDNAVSVVPFASPRTEQDIESWLKRWNTVSVADTENTCNASAKMDGFPVIADPLPSGRVLPAGSSGAQ